MSMEVDVVVRQFENFYSTDSDFSIGLAAVKTLLKYFEEAKDPNARLTTLSQVTRELCNMREAMCTTDHSYITIRGASEIFIRNVTLASREENDDAISKVMGRYYERGRQFVEEIAKSRSLISQFARPFIHDNMRILTHSFSRVVLRALVDARKGGVNVHVFVTEANPDCKGATMVGALREAGIRTTLILDAAVGYLMESIDAVMVGAEGVVETGGVINRIGTLGVAICAKAMNKPVYVMAESIKFVMEYPLNQRDIPLKFKYRASILGKPEGRSQEEFHPKVDLAEEHPRVDYTPPQYINLLFTNLGILTPAAVGDELIKLYT